MEETNTSPIVRIVSIWRGMKMRCLNPKNIAYPYYGGRGVKICERWMKFENFLEDMGLPPSGTSIHRINNGGNYEPGNCKWATMLEQSRNRRKQSHRSRRPLPQKLSKVESVEGDFPIIGLQAIADYLFRSVTTVKSYSRELQKKGIFISRLRGKPKRRVIISYPSLLQQIRDM